ncbi:MAG: complex I 51 kDa subunit family protein [Enterobacteriaceae bacterium]
MKFLKKNEFTHPITWMIKNKNCTIDIKSYKKNNGYETFRKSINKYSSIDIIKIIENSKLRGRGGAGFFTGIKWKLVKESTKSNKKCYLICNADEMEPGSYKDRFLIEKNPHLLIEGILITAYALKSKIGYIFIRNEYFYAEKCLKKAIIEAKNNNLLGKNILNTNFEFNLFIHTGAGRYICGEETALINCLEGKRANPRLKPPFPTSVGFLGKPTCVNNVETLCNVPVVLKLGSKAYRNISIKKSKDAGTKLMGVSGRVKNPGIWEVPFGTTIRELLEKYAKGMEKGYNLKAIQPGGGSTGFLLPRHLDTPMDFENISKVGSRLGTATITIIDKNISMISVLKNLETFFSRESCGWCSPCREGLSWSVNILKDLENKIGSKEDIKILRNICNLANNFSFCAHAIGAVSPLISALDNFEEDFEKCIKF